MSLYSEKTTTFQSSKTLSYLLSIPEGTPPASGWPLMLFLHGAGERGSNLADITRHGPPKMAADGEKLPFILVAPQCPAGCIWHTPSLIHLLDTVIAEHPVDPQRVSITGISMGGFGTWGLISEYPERFSAAAPICGGGELIRVRLLPEEKKPALRSLPIQVFHGEADEVIPLEESLRMVELFRKYGNELVELTTYPGVAHDSWTQTYRDTDVIDWLIAQRR